MILGARRLMGWFEAWMEPCAAPGAHQRRRMRFYGACRLVVVAVAASYAAIYWQAGAQPLALAVALAGLLQPVLTWWARRSGSIEATIDPFLLSVTGTLILGVHASGGAAHLKFASLLVVPMYAGLLGGARRMGLHAFIVGLYVVVALHPPGPWLEPFYALPREAVIAHGLTDTLATIACIAIVIYVFIRETRRAQEEAELALSCLATENRERTAAEERAVRAARAKSEFLAVMSHELRTPLNGVMGMADVFLEAKLDDELRGCAQTIKSSSKALLAIIDDILDLSKLEAGKLALYPEPVDLAALASDVLQLARHGRKKEGVELSLDLDPNDNQAVVLDEGRLRQVLLNLVGNAVKFTERGQVRLSVRHSPTVIRFEVHDTGIGIPPERLGDLFCPFEQVHTGSIRHYGGTGLGLAISKRIVEAMEGSIGVGSELGRGSVFWFEIPRAVVRECKAPATPHATLELPGTVLVADDNPVNRMVCGRLLRGLHLTSEAVESGAQAVERTRGGGISVVLMDLQMPGIDGLEATRMIREAERSAKQPRTTIVGLSANMLPEHREAALAAGMDGYLTKPLDQRRLLEVLAQVSRPVEAR